MSALGLVFLASLGVLFVDRLRRGGRLRFFSLTSIPIAIVVYLAATILLWKSLAPPSISDTNAYALIGIAETALAIGALAYVITSMTLKR